MNLSKEFKVEVVGALLENRKNFDGSDSMFARQFGVNNSVFSRLKNGQIEGLLKDGQWLEIGRRLNVTINKRQWNAVRTEVFEKIEEEILFCKTYGKSKMFVDECEIGKSFTAKYLSRKLKNCFYIDCSQTPTKREFIKKLAHTLGLESVGTYTEIVDNIKYYLHVLPQPMLIIDEAGDLEYKAFLTIKGLWNATENICGWYIMGADGLQKQFERGISNKKVGYRELFSRFSGKPSSIVPPDQSSKLTFYRNLITEVLSAQTNDKKAIELIVKKCLVQQDGYIGGLRRAESLLILYQREEIKN
jgi:hypothetical protein